MLTVSAQLNMAVKTVTFSFIIVSSNPICCLIVTFLISILK